MEQMNPHKNVSELLFYMNSDRKFEDEILIKAFYDILTLNNIKARDTQLGMLLFGMMGRNLEVRQIKALIETALSIDEFKSRSIKVSNVSPIICVAGSGKKGIKTINISTPACIVAASAGARVIKPGSSSTSSVTGSYDFMKEVFRQVNNNIEENITILEKTGFAFYSIENLIPRFDSVYGQKMLGVNALSFAFPAILCPIKYDALLYGLSHHNVMLSANTLNELGVENARIVSSTDDNVHFIDEFAFLRNNYVASIDNGIVETVENINTKEELGLLDYSASQIRSVNNQKENIRYGLKVLIGEGENAHEDIIALNAAQILCLANVAKDYKEGYKIAKEKIHTGATRDKLFEIMDACGVNRKII